RSKRSGESRERFIFCRLFVGKSLNKIELHERQNPSSKTRSAKARVCRPLKFVRRSSAKLLTASGAFCCLVSLLFLAFYLKGRSDGWLVLCPVLLVAGIILIILSLAYYTEPA